MKKQEELEKVVVPQFIADWIEDLKYQNFNLLNDIYDFKHEGKMRDYIRNHSDTLMRAWLDGYEIEKSKTFTFEVNAFEEIVIQADNEDEAKAKAHKEWQHRFKGMFGGVELIEEVEE